MRLLQILEEIRTPFLDFLFSLVTRLGEETVAMLVLCVIFWCINKKLAYGIGVAFFLSGLSVQCLKIGFRVERPWVLYPGLTPVRSALGQATGYSFPSGHTQGAAALFGSLGLTSKKRLWKAVCGAVIILVAFSRMYLGVHTLTDTSAALVLSLIIVAVTYITLRDGEIKQRGELLRATLFIAFSIITALIALFQYSAGEIEQTLVSDCFKAAGAGVGFAAGMYCERMYIGFDVRTKGLVSQVIKVAAGVAVVLLIKEGMKLVFGTAVYIDVCRYFLMLMWVTCIYPIIIKRIF